MCEKVFVQPDGPDSSGCVLDHAKRRSGSIVAGGLWRLKASALVAPPPPCGRRRMASRCCVCQDGASREGVLVRCPESCGATMECEA